MIYDMYNLAKAFLESSKDDPLGQHDERKQRLTYVCEVHEPGSPIYVLYPKAPGVTALRRQQLKEGQSWRLPFIKVAPNAAYLAPVFKVERKQGGKESKRRATLKHFERIANSKDPAAAYFAAVCDVLQARDFIGPDRGAKLQQVDNAYGAAVTAIVQAESGQKGGEALLLLTAIDPAGEVWPGDDPRLVDWLLRSPERLSIYGEVKENLPSQAVCPLCGRSGPLLSNTPAGADLNSHHQAVAKAPDPPLRLFSNAPAGAGLNFVNGAFRGSFPEMNEERAWQRFATCAVCADLLYVYRNHVAPDYIDVILGSRALVVPSAGAALNFLSEFAKRFRQAMLAERRELEERQILRWLAQNQAQVPIATVSLVWAEFGQKYENIRGLITHVLPTRLARLERDVHDPQNQRSHPFFPQDFRVRRQFDLNLGLAAELLRRPGGKQHGKQAENENKSPCRLTVLQEIGRSVFHGTLLPCVEALWHEIDRTAQFYWKLLLEQENAGIRYHCNYEGPNKIKGKLPSLTVCGWVRHVYAFLDYLRHEIVHALPKETAVYVPTEESLRPLFAQAEGLENPAKRFAFLLGVLYGHLIYVQADKAGVNVAANALSWMRGGRLRADELPELHAKVTSKLLEYHALKVGGYRKFERVYALEAELDRQGIRVGDHLDPGQLADNRVLYFLMLGIGLSYSFTR